jgi:hypothetical protein
LFASGEDPLGYLAMLTFQKNILDLIQKSPSIHNDAEFNELALQSFAYQLENNSLYKDWCHRFKHSLSPEHWSDIPALPVSLFKHADIVSFPVEQAEHVFKTSGTTKGQLRGKHYLKHTCLYEAVIDALAEAYLFKDKVRLPFLSLVNAYEPLRESSLSYMVNHLNKKYGLDNCFYAINQGEVHFEQLCLQLELHIKHKQPVFIATTAFAWAAFLEYLETNQLNFALPSQSHLMDTGGFKGRSKTVSREILVQSTQKLLGIKPADQINEYGMTELLSHFYDYKSDHSDSTAVAKVIPAWTRVLITNPQSGEICASGQKGLIRIIDLANQDSVIAVQTEDEGRYVDGGFEILGRQAGSDLRGCSLSFEQLESEYGHG